MATKGKKLVKAFKDLRLNPKYDTPEELEKWLKEMADRKTDTKSTTVHTNQPRLSIFYGENATKGEIDYEQWRYEVKSLLLEETYKEDMIMQAIRRSVRGEAIRILMRLGTGVDIETILEKFESVYSTVDTKEELLAKFYSAKQGESEDITAWSCRLEDLLSRVVEQGMISHHDSEEMLRTKFWAGLRQDLKDISGFKFEMINDFDKLRVELRKMEREHKLPEKETKKTTNLTQHVSPATENKKNVQPESEITELKQLVQDMSIRVNDMGKKLSELQEQQTTNTTSNRQNYTTRGRSRFRQSYNPTPRFNNGRERGFQSVNTGPQCYRCRQFGHFQWQCNVRLDHSKHLNWRPPCTKGGY